MIRKYSLFLFFLLGLGHLDAQENDSYLIFSDTPKESSSKEIVIIDFIVETLGIDNTYRLNNDELDLCLPEKGCFNYINDNYPSYKILKFDFFDQNETTFLIFSLWDQSKKVLISSKSIECNNCSTLSILGQLPDLNFNAIDVWDEDDNTMIISSSEGSLGYKYNQKGNFDQRYYTINFDPSPPANIIINDFDFGLSPVAVSSDKKETIEVKVQNNDYELYSTKLTFGKDKKLTKKLKAVVANLLINSNPPGAEVFINNKKVGKTNKNKNRTLSVKDILLNQTLNIKLELKNHVDNEITWSPYQKGNNYLTVDLERGKGFLRIMHEVDSDRIEVIINGISRGKMKSKTLTLDSGKQQVKLRYNDGNEKIEREKDVEIPMDDYAEDWSVNFMDSAPVVITF